MGCNEKITSIEGHKWVCVCDENHCDEFRFRWPNEAGRAVQVVSSRAGKRFRVSSLKLTNRTSEDIEEESRISRPTVLLDLDQQHQSIMGWGGAFTDSTGINVFSLTAKLSRRILESYFGEHGLQYNFGRVPLGGTDFSTRMYSYNNHSGDFGQTHWALASEDLDYKIPMIKRAQELCANRGVHLKLLASPWSAPAWMKTSQSLVRGSLKDDERIYQSYVEYLLKFYRAYRENGIEFWGATVQNEPFAATLPLYSFNSMSFSDHQMIKLIGEYLGPALEAEGMGRDKFKLMVGDDSLGFIDEPVVHILSDPRVRRFVSGLAIHWYTSGSSLKSYERLTNVYERVKDQIEFVAMTEACNGFLPLSEKVDLGSWARGEAYAFDIIQDMLRETSAWIDWNMALSPTGGPSWANNFVDSPIIVDAKLNRFYKQPMYYVLAHFTRFFKPGSIRVSSQVKNIKESLQVLAAKSPDKSHLVVNILNRSEYDFIVDVLLDKSTTSSSNSKSKSKSKSNQSKQDSHEFKAVKVEAKSISSIILKL